MIIALVETRRRCPGVHLFGRDCAPDRPAVAGPENIFFPVPLLVAFLVVCWRAGLPLERVRLGVIALPMVSLVGLLILNQYQYGHLLGAPLRRSS